MASTTKTVNLELSQFVGTDKPAWLTDYNGDMQKIDDGYKKLEDANTATQADLDATKQNLDGSKSDISNLEAEVQALTAADVALQTRATVLEANYDTMHHEVAVNAQDIADMKPYAMIAADKKASIHFRNADLFAVDYDNDKNVALLDIAKDGVFNRIAAILGDTGNNTLFMQQLNSNGMMLKSSEITVGANKGINFQLINDEEADIHFQFEDKAKFVTIRFNKTSGISMSLNDHGSVTQLFNIPVPNTP